LVVPYTPDHRRRTRRRILESAARIVRRRGAAGAGVDAIMAEAGLTAGGFYAHFRKKDTLLAEIVGGGFVPLKNMLFVGLENVRGVPFLTAIARRYLSRSHRDDVDNGCIVPAVLGELPRLGSEVGAAFEVAFRDLLERLEPHVPATSAQSSRDRAMATMALFAGGVMLARAVEDRELSNQILAACRRFAVPEAYAVDGTTKGRRA
jgi:TetR/AcrR family transcriptional repressor of nem operon